MDIKPISKSLYDTLTSRGVESFTLEFQGGSDEGYLNVDVIFGADHDEAKYPETAELIEEWAWSVYDYSGAGEGQDYGDDIVYNLKDGTVSHNEWSMERRDYPNKDCKLNIGDNDDTE